MANNTATLVTTPNGQPVTTSNAKLVYHAEMQNACQYSMRNPRLAAQCAATAVAAAMVLRNPALTYQANTLLALVRG